MSDLISRKAAIDAIEHITSSMSVCVNVDECHGMKRMQRQAVIELANLPSAQRWIPVSERLPEEKQDVLFAFKHNMAVGFWEDILHNGEPVWYANSGDGWMAGTESVDNDGIPTAWMPLPEPWKGE